MQVVDANGNVFGQGLEITGIDGKPKVPVINTDITIGTTAIIGGVVGRILFEGTGSVVQESSSFTYDDTLKKFTLTGPIGSVIQHTALTNYNDFGGFQLNVAGGAERAFMKLQPNSGEFKLGVTGSGYFTTFHTSGLERARIFQNGNFAVNTTTDSGFKFDVAGTIRSQGSLFISNPSFTMGGSITHSANATLVITGGPGAGGENITFGPSNRIFINAGQTRFPSGSVQMASTLTLGSTNATGTNMLLMQGSITAGSALGRGIGMDTTLIASANNDVLVGLDIAPTFSNGAFTGVQNYAARFGGNIVFQPGATRTISVLNPTSSGSGNHLVIQSGSATTSGNGGDIYLNVGGGAGGPGPGRIYIGNNNGWDVAYVRGLLTVNNSGPNTGVGFQVNSGGQTGLSIYWDNLTPFMQYGLVVNRQARFVNSSSYTFSSKVFINTTVDSGFNFDVNGTARVQGNTTVTGTIGIGSGSSFLSLSGAANNNVIQGTQTIEYRSGGGTLNRAYHNFTNSLSFTPTADFIPHVNMAATFAPTSGTGTYAQLYLYPTINQTGTASGAVRGFYYNPTLTSVLGIHYAIHTTSGRVRLEGLPTSPTGLSAGDLYNNLGVLMIV
jgi:hypothetical protein